MDLDHLNLAFRAMQFARHVHRDQVRKYTGNPYAEHLGEVAGIAVTVAGQYAPLDPQVIVATAWLHDSMEDCGVLLETLQAEFGEEVAQGVLLLSDLETGNRAQRKAASRERLSRAPAWVQSIKVADLISNTQSISLHDPNFARLYLREKRLLLDVMTEADPRLVAIARAQAAAPKAPPAPPEAESGN